LLSAAEGKGFATGAAAAGANEALINQLSSAVNGDPGLLTAASQIVGLVAAASVGGDIQTGANIAKDATAYNRIPHEQQKQWFKDKASGDPKMEAQLSAAACALIQCSSGFPEGSEQYNYYKSIENLGNSPEYASIRQEVQNSGLFEYGGLDSVIDAVGRYQVGTRLFGAVQAVNGTLMSATGAAISVGTDGFGAIVGRPLFVAGADNTAAGIQSMVYGDQTYTLGAQGLSQALGISPTAAEMLYGLGTGAGEMYGINQIAIGFGKPVISTEIISNDISWNRTSALTDAEAGTLVERNVLSSGAKGGTALSNDVLIETRIGNGTKGQGSGNKVEQLPNKQVVGADGKPIPVYSEVPKRPNGPYAIQEFPSTPVGHGFPDIVDNYANSATKFSLNNGSSIYQVLGSYNGVAGRFEWIVDPRLDGVTHRMFVPNGTINGIPVKP
jgi:filamentous hemagglutinin